MTVRPVRCNNPGDLRVGAPWIGLADPSDRTPENMDETEFCVFKSPVYGFRALALTLLTYYRRYKLKTIYQIITRFAPANENDTAAYVTHVADSLGVLRGWPLNLEDFGLLAGLCRAIAVHEAGGWMFNNDDLNTGVAMALGHTATPIDPDKGPLAA